LSIDDIFLLLGHHVCFCIISCFIPLLVDRFNVATSGLKMRGWP